MFSTTKVMTLLLTSLLIFLATKQIDMGEFNISFSDDEALDYIRKLENPHKVGWDGKVWRTPKGKGFDNNQIAYGLDIRQENNPIVYNFLKTKGRLNDPWLTDAEAKKLTALTFAQKKDSIAKAIAIAGGNVSQMGYNRLAGMAWHGDPMKRLLDKDSITGKAFREEVANGNKEFTGTFDTYYNYGSNKKRYADRAAQDYTFRPQYVLNDAGKKLVINPAVYTKEQFQPDFKLQQPTKTVYPLNNEVPQSISSWSGADAPNATPRMPSLQEQYDRRQNEMWDIFDQSANAYGSSLQLPSLESMMQLNSPEEQIKRWTAQALNVPQLYVDMPALQQYKDGKSPIHIKPGNRGKLTRLKKRTGKSESELYKTGGPAVRKMITFARNARKWKH